MSFHFYLPATKDISYQEILDGLSHKKAAIAWQEEYDLSKKAESCRFYIPHRSSRGIGFYLDDNQYDIAINVLSSREDNELALDLCLTLAGLLQAEITPEDSDESMNPAAFKERFDQAWVERNTVAGTGSVQYMVNDPQRGGTITIGGCFRDHYIGKNLLTRLTQDQPNEATLHARLIDNIRETQFIDDFDYRIPGIYTVTPKEANESKWEYVVVSPENNFFLPKTEYLVLFMDKENHVKIPYQRIHEIADDHFRLVDEEQYFVKEISLDNFERLMALARQPKENPEQASKKSWKFWKKNE